MVGVFAGLCAWLIPDTFTFQDQQDVVYTRYGPFWAAFCGCVSGLIIGLVTEFYTSSTYKPVQELIENCLSEGGNSATNIV
jgi:Na+/H+-translocating membrane pyrophosphatase